MSMTTDIACHSCKEKFWIGQNTYLYTDEKNLRELNLFLQKHRYHQLVFGYFDDADSLDAVALYADTAP